MRKSLATAALLAAILLVALLWTFSWKRTPQESVATTRAVQNSDVSPAIPHAAPEESAPISTTSEDFGAWAGEEVREPDFAKLAAFDGWLERWQAASPEERKALEAEGAQLAAARRPEFKALIISDPKRALETAVPPVVRQDLPQRIVALLETPVSAVGDYNVYMGRPAPGTEVPREALSLRYFEAGGVSYQAHVFGEMEPVMSRKQIPLRGVAVDRPLAVAESPLRQLDVGERIPVGTPVEAVCPVSGKTTEAVADGAAVAKDTPTVEVGGRVITLCNGSHVAVLDEKYRVLVQASGAGGPGFFMDAFPGTSSRAIGNFRCLYIRATYPDQLAPPNTEDQAVADMTNNAKFYLENSYGKMTATSTVTPLIVLPQTLKWYQDKDAEVDGLGVMHSQARASARALGYDSTQYDCIIVRVNGGLRSGASWGGGDSVWLGWGGMDVINHECGHSLGLGHANYWATTDGTAYGQGANQEYGNPFDVMGGGGGYGAHYNTNAKRNLGWLPTGAVHYPKTNGVFRLTAFDQPRLEEGKFYSLNVAKDTNIQYTVEYHTNNSTLANQATVLYGGRLIDTTPGSPGGKNDSGIQLGRTFSDLEADMHFTFVAKNATSPPSIDVAYFRGPFPGNVAPQVALAASATTINVGETVTFTATASDANGDALAYQWDFDDGSSAPNAAVVSKTFTSAAQVTAMVTVSDMKGLTTRRFVVINVGNHGKRLVTGQITVGGAPLANVRVSITNGKYALTDADGNYALSGVTSGSQTLTATFNGYSFTPFFTNPLTVGSGTNTANWTAGGSTFVTLAKTADATEGGANGSFTLTRTGDTTADLVVRVSPVGGTAVKGTDYTFTPDFVNDGSYRTFTIPAGQASLVVDVAAINDTTAEGPETITLQLASNGNYLQTTANSAVMTIADNDTTLPQVAVTAPDPYAMEPADAGSFVFTRTGPTSAALNLSIAWTGTAINGTDYVTLPATVTIPAGQSSVAVAVTPIDDSLIEIPETIIATINTNAAYLRDSSATSATVTLSDDDTPVVTVRVLDGNASEDGPRSGVFLIERSGSTAAALKVYYGLSGSAFHGTDYRRLNGEVTIPAGATGAPVVITPYDDDIAEGPEDVTLAVTTFNDAYSLGEPFRDTLTIADKVGLPVISVRAGAVGTEGVSNATVIFRVMGTGTGNVTVNYAISGTATAGSDYTALSGTVSVPASGPSDVTVTIPVIDDPTPEPTETVVVTLLPGAGYAIFNDTVAEAAIRDNDSGAARVAVTAYHTGASESGSVGKFYISRPDKTGELTVNYAMSGTATSGADYTGLTGTAVIPDGESGVVVTFTPVDDALAEGTETVILNLTPGTGYSVDRPASATLEIADNDTAPITVGFVNPSGVTSELPDANGQYRDIAVKLSAVSADNVTVQCISGSGTSATGDDVDWAFVDAANGNAIIPTATVTFPPGVTNGVVRLKIKNDGVSETPEIAVLELRAPRFAGLTSGKSKYTLTIFDDVIPNLITEERWNNQAVYTNQSWSGSAPDYTGFLTGFTPPQNVADSYSRRLTGQIVAPATGPYTFWIASDDASRLYLSTTSSAANKSQIASVSGWVDFQVWDTQGSQKSATINLTAGQSYYMEVQHQEGGGGDHVSVAWSGPGFTRQAITSEIPDNSPRSVRFAVSASTRNEVDGNEPLLMAFLDRPAGSTPVTVDYTSSGTAIAGSDYILTPGTLVFNKGEQSKLLPFSILADGIGESPEAVVVTLSNAVGATLTAPVSHTITLLDADAPVVSAPQLTALSTMSSGTVLGTASATLAPGRSVAAWSIVAGNENNVFAIDASGKVSLLSPAALPNPGTRQLVARVTDNAGATGDGVVNIVCNPPATLGVTEQRWAGATAYNNQIWTGTTNYSGTLPTFTTPQDVADNYSRRLTGLIQPQVTGNYTFWIASDDESRLFLSTTASATNKVQIATVSGWTDYQAWDSNSSQKSAVISMVAGKVYWMEVHHHEGGGGDHASVAWSGPGISRQALPASAMFPSFGSAPVLPSIALTSPAADSPFTTASSISLTAETVGGSLPITAVEFYRGTTLIGSDSSAPYSLVWNAPTAGTHILTARALNTGGAVTSSAVTITVTGVNHPPVFTTNPLLAAAATVAISYSGNLASSASDPDSGDTLTFSKVSGPTWLTIGTGGSLSGTPAAGDAGLAQFVVRATDAGGLFAETTLRIEVIAANVLPVFAADPLVFPSAMHLVAYMGNSLATSATDPDGAPGDSLTFAKKSGPAWLTVATDGKLAGTPSVTDIGPNSFVVRVTDPRGGFAEATLQIAVVPADFYYDTNASGAGSGAASGGAWTTAAAWSADPNGVAATFPWADGANAIFSAGADAASSYTVTLDGTRAVAGIVVRTGNPQLSGGSISLTKAATPIDVRTTAARIDSPLGGVGFGLVKTGPGTLVLGGNNTFTGNTTIENGVLELTPAAKLYNGGYTNVPVVTILTGGTWRTPDFSYAATGQLADYAQRRVLAGGVIEVTGPTHNSGQNFTSAAAGGTFRYTPSGQTLTLSGNANSNLQLDGPLTFDTGGDITVTEVLQGNGSLLKTGNGTLYLNQAANTFAGDITVSAGILQTAAIAGNGSTSALGSVTGSRTITVDGGTLRFASANVFGGSGKSSAILPKILIRNGTLDSTHFNVLGNLALESATLQQSSIDSGNYEGFQFLGTITVGGHSPSFIATGNGKANHLANGTTPFAVADATSDAAADLVISTPLRNASGDYGSGVGSLAKTGAGTLELAAANIYTGSTTVSAGTLALTGSIISAVNVETDGTLTGTGTASGSVSISGKLAPGIEGIGTLTTGALTIGKGASLHWDLASAAPHDLVNAASLAFAVDSNIVVKLTGANPAAGSTTETIIPLIATTGGISGFGNATFTVDTSAISGAAGVWEIVLQGNVLALRIAPEVSPWGQWQQIQFGENASNPAIAGPDADPDGDALTNKMEMALGLNPNDPNSRLTMAILPSAAAGTARFRLSPAVTSGTYRLESSDTLTGDWEVASTITAVEAADSLEFDVPTSATHRFFRLTYSIP